MARRKNDNWDHRLRVVQTVAAIVGIMAAVLGYLDFRRKAELQALRGLHDAQLATCKQVSNAAAQLYEAANQKEFEAALSNFSRLKHGEALAILDAPVLDAMLATWGSVYGFKPEPDAANFNTLLQYRLCDDPLKVVLACRHMLSDGFRSEGGNAIKLLDENVVMQTAKCTRPSPVPAPR